MLVKLDWFCLFFLEIYLMLVFYPQSSTFEIILEWGLVLLEIWLKRRIFQRSKTIYLVCIQTGKVTWPLKYQKSEKLHQDIKKGEIALIPNEVEELLPTWGNYLTGLLNFLGCQEHLTPKERR